MKANAIQIDRAFDADGEIDTRWLPDYGVSGAKDDDDIHRQALGVCKWQVISLCYAWATATDTETGEVIARAGNAPEKGETTEPVRPDPIHELLEMLDALVRVDEARIGAKESDQDRSDRFARICSRRIELTAWHETLLWVRANPLASEEIEILLDTARQALWNVGQCTHRTAYVTAYQIQCGIGLLFGLLPVKWFLVKIKETT